MVHYGYDRRQPDYKVDREATLLERLSDMVDDFRTKHGLQAQGRPYVDTRGASFERGLMQGVFIRGMTHLTKEQDAELVKLADDVYRRVMDVPAEVKK